MSSIFNTQKTYNHLDIIINNELKAYEKEVISKNNYENMDTFLNGELVYSISAKSTALTNLINTDWRLTDTTPSYSGNMIRGTTTFLENVTESIVKVTEPYSFAECMNTIKELIGLMGEEFYGVLLVVTDIHSNKTVLLNPLHPLTLLAMIDDLKDVNSYTYKMVVYKYSDLELIKGVSNDSSYVNLKERCEKNIDSLISSFSNKNEINKLYKIHDVKPEEASLYNDLFEFNTVFKQYYTESLFDEDGETEIDYSIVPISILAKGIAAPYYGTALIRSRIDTDEVRGTNLAPFRSVNIDVSRDELAAAYRDSSAIPFGSICTGSKSKTTIEGLRTLTHSNLSSALTSTMLDEGFLTYQQVCIEKSLQLFDLIDSLLEEMNQPTNELNEAQELINNMEISLDDGIEANELDLNEIGFDTTTVAVPTFDYDTLRNTITRTNQHITETTGTFATNIATPVFGTIHDMRVVENDEVIARHTQQLADTLQQTHDEIIRQTLQGELNEPEEPTEPATTTLFNERERNEQRERARQIEAADAFARWAEERQTERDNEEEPTTTDL